MWGWVFELCFLASSIMVFGQLSGVDLLVGRGAVFCLCCQVFYFQYLG